MNKVYTSNAPEALGPYSQAIVTGNMVFTSGQIAINPATNAVEATDIQGQTEQVMKNLGEVLKEAGSSFEKAVKTTCFLKNIFSKQNMFDCKNLISTCFYTKRFQKQACSFLIFRFRHAFTQISIYNFYKLQNARVPIFRHSDNFLILFPF